MYEKNIALLKEKFPRIHREVTASDPAATNLEIGVGQSRTGLPVPFVIHNGRKVFLNSSYDPEQEAERWLNSNFDREASGSCILCGGGFFYHVRALLEAGFLKKLVVYEPDLQVLKACLSIIDFEPILKHDNLFILTGTNFDDMARGVMAFLTPKIIYSDANLITKSLPGYQDLFGVEIGNFMDKVREQISLFQINLTTLEMFAKEWLFNSFKNLNSAITSPVMGGFLGKFKDMPAILVSAGPSLQKNIHLLKSIKEKALIICCGSSIRAMVRNGILPHILVAMDSPEVNSQVYDDLDLRDVYLAYICRFWHKSVANFAGRKILCKTDVEGIPDLFITQNRGMEIGVLRSGFSVSHTAFDLAVQLGCDPIVLIGQDLAYSPDNKRYAEGQISATIEFFEQEKVKRDLIVLKDIYGQDVVTDYELNGFRIIFEMLLEMVYHGKVKVINATEGGVPIKGTVNRKLAEVIAEYCRVDKTVSNRMDQLYEEGLRVVQKHPIDAAGFCKKLNTILERAGEAMTLLIERMQSLRKQNFNNEFNIDKLEPVLKQIASDYDLALNYKEYHMVLKDFHSSVLYVLKAQLDRLDEEFSSAEDYDKKLQIYMNIIINTKDVLDFAVNCINDYLAENNTCTTNSLETGSGLSDDISVYETRIKQGKGLKELTAQLEEALRDQNNPRHGTYLYLYGLVLIQKGDRGRAIVFLEQAVKEDNSLSKAYFSLYKLYSKNQNRVKALDCLSQCCRLDYRKQYCLRKRIRLSYRSGDYVTVNNLIGEFVKEFSDAQSHRYLKIESLIRLDLMEEAKKIWCSMEAGYGSAKRVAAFIQSLLAVEGSNPYQEQYQKNALYLEKRFGHTYPPYDQIQYKVCRFLGGEFVYDNKSGTLFPGVNHVQDVQFSLTENDVLAIFNSDNSRVFEHLHLVLNRIQSGKYKEQIGMIPVLIFEQEPEQWYYISQLFDFRLLDDWKNLHLFLGETVDLTKLFLEDATPYPNILYATDPKPIQNAISYAHNEKDPVYATRLAELVEYYRENRNSSPQKVVILGSLTEQNLIAYGKAWQSFFEGQGVQCIVSTENLLYYKRTVYADAKLIYEFRPDLIISMVGIQDELELYKQINVPFISWLQFDRQLQFDQARKLTRQRFWITGNPDFETQLTTNGYPVERITSMPLPVLTRVENEMGSPVGENGIGIFANLNDLEELVENIEVVLRGIFISKGVAVHKQEIIAVVKALYVSLFMGLNNEGLKYYNVSVYEEAFADNLKRRNLKLEASYIQSISPLLKKEFDNLLATSLQVKWIINELHNFGVEIYGSGWQNDPTCRPFHKGEIDSITHLTEFGKAVRRNKVNLYPGVQINNKSYMQPDLINGIAAGGFFLVNDLWFREYGDVAIEAFGGMLEIYGSKTELEQKAKYFLEHDDERIKKARMLQEHVNRHFRCESLAKKGRVIPET